MRLYALLAALAILSACESTVTNVTPPQVDPELVVFGFISPEADSILIEVRMTTPVFTGGDLNNDRVSDATVLLKSPSNSLVIPYTTNGRYVVHKSQFPLSPGTIYALEVTTPRGHLATASTRIPIAVPTIDSIQAYSIPQGFGESLQMNRAFWQDSPSETNFYRVMSRSVQPNGNGDTSYFTLDNAMLSDESKNGLRLNGSVEYYGFEPDSIQSFRDIVLLSTDEAYYKYHVKRLNYTGTNPFEEPLPMFDNIDGGVGCFSSYRFSRYNIGF